MRSAESTLGSQEGFVLPEKKKWARPGQPRNGPGVIGRGWAQEELRRVRELARDALDLIEAKGVASEAAAQLRLAIAKIDAELAAARARRNG
jgi:hypothetical protein